MNLDWKQIVGMVGVGVLLLGVSYYAGIITGKYISGGVQNAEEMTEGKGAVEEKETEKEGIELTFYEELTKPKVAEEAVTSAPTNITAPVVEKKAEELKGREVSSKKIPHEKFVPPLESNKYTVQIASFQKRSDAVTLVNRLKKKGYPAYILSAKVGDKVWFRVRVGEYSTKSEAVKMLQKIERSENLKGYVTLKER